MSKNRSHALIVLGSSIFFADRARIVALASENRLPSMYLLKQYVEAGGLMSYGASNRESIRRAATYVDKVLKGAKAADLPIEQATTEARIEHKPQDCKSARAHDPTGNVATRR